MSLCVIASCDGGAASAGWRGRTVQNPIVPGTILSKNEDGIEVDATKFKQAVGSLIILEQIGAEEKEETVILCDNNSAIQLSRNPIFHGRSKHIAVRFHFLRDLVNDEVVRLSPKKSSDLTSRIHGLHSLHTPVSLNDA
ncbi:hypothetical protein CR513_05069, partial [Mucuna pruriens]